MNRGAFQIGRKTAIACGALAVGALALAGGAGRHSHEHAERYKSRLKRASRE